MSNEKKKGCYSIDDQKIAHQKLIDFFGTDNGGFVIIYNGDKQEIFDSFNNIHKDCLENVFKKIINEADNSNLFMNEIEKVLSTIKKRRKQLSIFNKRNKISKDELNKMTDNQKQLWRRNLFIDGCIFNADPEDYVNELEVE